MIATMNMIIGEGKSLAHPDGWLELVDPATEEVHARVPHASAEDVDRAVQAARRAFDEGPWARLTPTERGKLMYRLAELINRSADELALMDTQDMGKPYRHAREHDVPGTVAMIEFYAGLCDKIRGSQVPCGPDKHVYLLREPVGVVAGICPWNFPLAAAAMKLGPALACGNTLVLKPAEQSPRSTLRVAELCLEAGFPPGVVNTVTGLGETTGAALAAHPAVDKISFTGSTEVGRHIMHAAADQIRKVTLELGGKTANIIFPDADLEMALPSTMFTSFYNSGQICTTGSRLVISRSIHDQFLAALTDRMKPLKVGHRWSPTPSWARWFHASSMSASQAISRSESATTPQPSAARGLPTWNEAFLSIRRSSTALTLRTGSRRKRFSGRSCRSSSLKKKKKRYESPIKPVMAWPLRFGPMISAVPTAWRPESTAEKSGSTVTTGRPRRSLTRDTATAASAPTWGSRRSKAIRSSRVSSSISIGPLTPGPAEITCINYNYALLEE